MQDRTLAMVLTLFPMQGSACETCDSSQCKNHATMDTGTCKCKCVEGAAPCCPLSRGRATGQHTMKHHAVY